MFNRFITRGKTAKPTINDAIATDHFKFARLMSTFGKALISTCGADMPSRFHDAAKILVTASPVWTLMTTAVDRGAVGLSAEDAARGDSGCDLARVPFARASDHHVGKCGE